MLLTTDNLMSRCVELCKVACEVVRILVPDACTKVMLVTDRVLMLPPLELGVGSNDYIKESIEDELMSSIPSDLQYLSSHEWVRIEDDGSVTIGITDHAQETLGDVVFVELPQEGTTLATGDEAGVVESVKAASDLICPLTGEVTAINTLLEDAPETVNTDPYNDGWLFKMKLEDDGELKSLLDAEVYAEIVESEA